MTAVKSVLTLYTGTGCHLCDRAKTLLKPLTAELGWQLREICITGDSGLQHLYGTRIPVIATADGRERGWPFTRGQIKKLLAG